MIREGTVSKKTNITSAQIRAARALLDWSARELSERSGVSQSSIHRAERAKARPSMHEQSLAAIKAAFEQYQVEFLDDSGVRLRSDLLFGSQAGGTPISRKPDIENRPEWVPGGHWRMDRRSTG